MLKNKLKINFSLNLISFPIFNADYTLLNNISRTGAIPKNTGTSRDLQEGLNAAMDKSSRDYTAQQFFSIVFYWLK